MTRALPFALALLLSGCARNTLSEADAAVAWDATSGSLARTTDPADSAAALLEGSFSFDCLDGGTLEAIGTWSAELDREAQLAETGFEYEIDFFGCQRDGVTIDGTLDFLGGARLSWADGFEASYVWTGQLDYSGEVEGSCVIDVAAEADASWDGASAGIEGTVCGNEISVLASVERSEEPA